MNSHELLELASLDAMGLLDAEERESFERAFRAAPPELQAQVRREQLRISRMDELLPAVEPPIGLRARVLAVVREAIANVAPIKLAAEGAAPALQPVRGVSRLWRAAAVGSLAAAIVLGFSTLRIRADYQALEETMASNATSDMFLREFGPRFDSAFFDSNTKLVAFSNPSAAGRAGKAAMLVDPVNRRAQLFTKDMAAIEGDYELVAVNADGASTRVLLTFRADQSGIKQHSVESVNLEGVSSFAIRRVGDAQPVLLARVA